MPTDPGPATVELDLGVVGPTWVISCLAEAAEARNREYVWRPTADVAAADACIVVEPANGGTHPVVHPAVFWSLDGTASVRDVGAAFARGFDAVVEGRDAIVVIAQLDALLRRPPPGSSLAVRRTSTLLAQRAHPVDR